MDQFTPLMLQKMKPNFKDLDFTIQLNGPFDIQQHVQPMLAEGWAKGMGVVVQLALVDLDEFVPDEIDETDETSAEENER